MPGRVTENLDPVALWILEVHRDRIAVRDRAARLDARVLLDALHHFANLANRPDPEGDVVDRVRNRLFVLADGSERDLMVVVGALRHEHDSERAVAIQGSIVCDLKTEHIAIEGDDRIDISDLDHHVGPAELHRQDSTKSSPSARV